MPAQMPYTMPPQMPRYGMAGGGKQSKKKNIFNKNNLSKTKNKYCI